MLYALDRCAGLSDVSKTVVCSLHLTGVLGQPFLWTHYSRVLRFRCSEMWSSLMCPRSLCILCIGSCADLGMWFVVRQVRQNVSCVKMGMWFVGHQLLEACV